MLIAAPLAAEPPTDTKAGDSIPAPSPPSADDITRWVRDLGNDSYSVRQEANTQLQAAGMAAREPLAKLAQGADPETRAAARRLSR